ncbi:Ribosomal RNA small subunit methyltransferase J [Candidatus Erwinia haradaeae]|uniref:Ribosomal RNA small subunit methyltransferase J n=1 Tax=Candidatus Erwinia haradaeae TaxID=1922217 RepID=A0A451CZ34_9GAMM|nr:class I SAM-dependent methyltransferase [Candidatus Erwinia haradaeae]VFP78657.1 Ribosomal RNA small subunit methyltransferase J [Candidatus Erwinia haradaeae]
MRVCLLDTSESKYQNSFSSLLRRWSLIHDPQSSIMLIAKPDHLAVCNLNEPELGNIFVNFFCKSITYRRRFGGGTSEAIAKAVGIKKNYFPNILDATAGFGRDSFILAMLGCHIRMLERNPVVAALLDDGLRRGYTDKKIGSWLSEHMTLLPSSSLLVSENIDPIPDVVYLDPMYPLKKKKALVKKEMRILQSLVGMDADADSLLHPARMLAKKRVVVKRPRNAQALSRTHTDHILKTKKHRFDIYSPINSFKSK